MAKKVAKRIVKAARYQKAHRDGSIKTLKRNIAKVFDLPTGSVQIVKRDGERVRADAKISTLRRNWSRG